MIEGLKALGRIVAAGGLVMGVFAGNAPDLPFRAGAVVGWIAGGIVAGALLFAAAKALKLLEEMALAQAKQAEGQAGERE